MWVAYIWGGGGYKQNDVQYQTAKLIELDAVRFTTEMLWYFAICSITVMV